MDFSNIDIIVSEIDGILTDGFKPIDNMNLCLFKNYCERDFEAINELKKFFTVVFLSTDSDVSYNIMRSRSIPAYFVRGGEAKLDVLTKRVMPRYNMQPNNLLYIGNKLSDVPCMNYAEYSLTIPASVNKVVCAANGTIEVDSGKGVITKLYEILYPQIEKRTRK
jgi:3-deoxy-D-manno-octulosonate 8-phosphate phosphatase KdsC-like HAD superfamily phosphatase